MKCCTIVISAFVLLASLGTARAAADDNRYAHRGQLIGAGDTRLNFYCSGTGSPTVVFDAGWEDWSPSWTVIQPAVSRYTRRAPTIEPAAVSATRGRHRVPASRSHESCTQRCAAPAFLGPTCSSATPSAGTTLGGTTSNRTPVPYAWHGKQGRAAEVSVKASGAGVDLPTRGRPKQKRVSDTPAGIAHAGKAVRDLLAHYTKQRDMTEGRVGLLLFGYLIAKLGAARVQREHDVATLTGTRSRGRPEQIDFVVGRTQHATGRYAANTVIEFAVRRTRHKSGADPIVNLSEIKKLVRVEAKHRILLLLDLTEDDIGAEIIAKYRDRGYSQGRPRGPAADRIAVIYVGEHGTHRVKLKRQFLKPLRRSARG